MTACAGSGAPTLLLIPTETERKGLAKLGGFEPGLAVEACCGFGPLAAAAKTAGLIERLRPARVVLLGIAGTYAVDVLPVGSAARFGRVQIEGLDTAGFEQGPGLRECLVLAGQGTSIGTSVLLLTVLSPSASPQQAAKRRQRFPGAVAEDMEGYGVAIACALAGVPLVIVRGISNEAGDRESRRWKREEALAASRELALELLASEGREAS